MKKFLALLLAFVLGVAAQYYFPAFSSRRTTEILTLKDSVTIYLDGRAMGVLRKGAQLTCIDPSEEGFNRAVLLLNYNSQPDSARYFEVTDSHVENLRIAYWSSKDVSPK